MAKKFQYKKRSAEDVKKRQNQGGGDFDTAYKSEYETWNPDTGEHKIRVLPPTWDGADSFGLDAYFHSGVGPDNQTYACLNKNKGERCPICEAVDDAKRTGDDKFANDCRAYKRVLLWIINRSDKTPQPVIYPCPWTLEKDWAKQCLDSETGEVLYVDDPQEGYDFFFSREGKGMKTKYTGAKVARRESALSRDDDQAEEWLEFVMENPLPEVINYYSAEHIEKVLSGTGAKKASRDDDDEEEEDERPTRSSRTSGRKRKPEPDDDDDDEDDEDEKPKRSKRKRATIDDEDEELDDDADEDDEPVKKKSKKSSSQDEEDEPRGRRTKKTSRSDDDDDDDDDDEEDEAPVKRKFKRKSRD
tara:strand:+ start:12524 stop:13600 length:1077 start_codon:yes stop_codon:yes gene_type:complete